MRKIILIVIVLWTGGLYSQYCSSRDFHLSTSIYTTTVKGSKGFEIRGEKTYWYLAFKVEDSYLKDKAFLNYGFSAGRIKKLRKFDFLAGVRLGLINIEQEKSRVSLGFEIESDYKIEDYFFIGIGFKHDTYFKNPHSLESNSESINRGFIKIGLKF